MVKSSIYDKFNCIADKCDFTCCQEWKIGVDEDTLVEWKKRKARDYYGEHVDENANDSTNTRLSDHVINVNDSAVIKLCDNRLCPFLNKDKLCNVVLKDGESFISKTCHTFPREYREYDSHTEHTLMLCCPHVIDLLNEEIRFDIQYDDGDLKSPEFNLRQRIIDYLQDDSETSVSGKMIIIYFLLLECYEKDVCDEDLWLLLPELVNTVKFMEHNEADTLYECNEIMLDLIDNYLKEGVYVKYLGWLSAEAYELEEKIRDCDILPKEVGIQYCDFQAVWNQYEPLMKKVFSQEIYGELIIEEADIEAMLVKYQWIAMEYVLLKQFCFLHYRKNGSLKYEDVKNYMVLAFRIMGFDDEDIFEYMENSFESLVWEWGYMALLLMN